MRAQYPFKALLSAATLLAACETNTAPDLPPSDDTGMIAVLNVAPSFATIEGRRLIKLTALLAGAATGTPQELVSWVSSDTNVATVAGGLVEGRKAGRVLITARLESARGFATVVVQDQVTKKPNSPPCLPKATEARLSIPGDGKC